MCLLLWVWKREELSRRHALTPSTLRSMPNHLTPEEIAAEHGLERDDVLRFCVEHDVPVFKGRIDKTLFAAEWQAAKGELPKPDQ